MDTWAEVKSSNTGRDGRLPGRGCCAPDGRVSLGCSLSRAEAVTSVGGAMHSDVRERVDLLYAREQLMRGCSA